MEEIAQPVASQVQAPAISLDQLINLCLEKEASDIHFREGAKLALRAGGQLLFIENADPLSRQEAQVIVDLLMPPEEKKKLQQNREIDFSYTHSNGINFRVNVFYQRGKLAGVMHMIPKTISTLESLNVPEIIRQFTSLKEGLILICGPAGSGKSATIQAMLNDLNENFIRHILTIENPVEMIFEDKKSILTQREVGKDTLSMANAIRSAARADANVVMISEIENFETLNETLDLVETGHLVISSLATKNTLQTLERLIRFAPLDLREQIQDRLSNTLSCILSQDLIEKSDQSGLVPVFEFMFVSPMIRNIIKRGNFSQLKNTIKSSVNQGMFLMDFYVSQLMQQGIVEESQAEPYLQNED